MRNFHKLAEGMNFNILLHSLMRQPELWNAIPVRTSFETSPHKAVDDILVRFNDLDAYMDCFTRGEAPSDALELETQWFPASHVLPVRPLLFDLLRTVEGERLGRVLITRLAPGSHITAHKDGKLHAEYYTRYHCVLQSFPGVVFRCGEETASMASGSVWWFNNSLEHEVINNSAEDRIVMIVDIRQGK